MESRSYAKANQYKSDQIAQDIADFEARGGKIQVLPTKHHDRHTAGSTVADPFNNRTTGKKKPTPKSETTCAGIEEEDDDTSGIDPSRETPAEQLEIEVE